MEKVAEMRAEQEYGNCWGGTNVKHKLKHFIWKSLKGFLLVNEVIKTRMGKGEQRASVCGNQVETLEHMFFFCKNAEAIWKCAPIKWDGLKKYRDNFWH